jgi:AcrR family transcriptional regulator
VEPSLVAAHPQVEPLLDTRDGAARARVLEAITQVVADKGYAAMTVADVCRAARISRGTFYALFEGKEDAFLQAHRHGIDVLEARIEQAVHEEPGDWIARLRAGLRAYVETLADEPRFARTYVHEIHAAGPRAQAARDEALRRFARRYGASFEAGARGRRGLRMPSDDALFVLTAGIEQLVAARVRERGASRLRGLEDELTGIAVAFLEGAATAPKRPTANSNTKTRGS